MMVLRRFFYYIETDSMYLLIFCDGWLRFSSHLEKNAPGFYLSDFLNLPMIDPSLSSTYNFQSSSQVFDSTPQVTEWSSISPWRQLQSERLRKWGKDWIIYYSHYVKNFTTTYDFSVTNLMIIKDQHFCKGHKLDSL